MKRRNLSRKIINLSTMVDVFMIVIFWYLMFWNQNFSAQKTNTQKRLDEQQVKYEAQIDGLEDELADSLEYIEELLEQIKQLEKCLGEMQKELDGQKEFSTALEQENAELKASNEELQGENENLKAMLNQEGRVLFFHLMNSDKDLRTLECTYEGEKERISFTDKERDKLAKFVSDNIRIAQKDGKMNVVFAYEGEITFSPDLDEITETIKEMQAEEYFIFNKINLPSYN